MYFADRTSISEAVNSGEIGFDNASQLDYSETIEGQIVDEEGNVIQELGNTDGIMDQDALLEEFLVNEISRLDDEGRKAYLESEEFQALYEAGLVKHRTLVRLSKNDDLDRRIHLAALQRAREKGDADWEALRKNRINERRLLDKIYAKYSMQVKRDAVQAQKRLIKITPNIFNTMRAIR